jgi:Cu-Zn family superoxide dismutase
MHGFHIHENGDCSAPDGSSAGGHFNPTDQNHGGPDASVHHIGDLGNIRADENGNATYEATLSFLSLGDGENSILNRGLIVHALEDDLVSQPTGAAGARLACGVIRKQ